MTTKEREASEHSLIVDYFEIKEKLWDIFKGSGYDTNPRCPIPNPDPQAHYYVSELHCNAFVWLN